MAESKEDFTQEAKGNDVAYPSLSIDWELYAEYLADADLSDDQKKELIETLWAIVVSFVDLGSGIHPVQQACGQNDRNAQILSEDLLSLEQNNPTNFINESAGSSLNFQAEKEGL